MPRYGRKEIRASTADIPTTSKHWDSRLSTIILVFLFFFLFPPKDNNREYKNIKGDGNSNENDPLDAWNSRNDKNQSAWTPRKMPLEISRLNATFRETSDKSHGTTVAHRSRSELQRKRSKPSEANKTAKRWDIPVKKTIQELVCDPRWFEYR